jgi:hypothetical protein
MKRVLTVVAMLLAAACGSSAPSPKEPKTRATVDEEEPEAKPPSRAARCADGSCFSCGEAVCLSGYYCAIGKAGHGCAWVSSCASRSTCACLASTLSANATCRCEEKNGGVYVTCDGASL